MRLLTLAGLVVAFGVLGWAQRGGGRVGRMNPPIMNPPPMNPATMNPVRPFPVPPNVSPFGNILFPGGAPTFPTQLGATVSGIPYGGVGYGGRGGYSGGYGRGRTVVVPYAVPLFYGGGYGPGYDYYPSQAQSPTNVTVVVPQQPAPSVIINQTYGNGEPGRTEIREYSATDVPEQGGLRVYEAPRRRTETQAPPTEGVRQPVNTGSYVRDDKPTIYLIAMKDSTVRQAIGYWTEGGGSVLAYVTPQASINRVNLDQVDRDLSVQLNAERKLEFDLKGR